MEFPLPPELARILAETPALREAYLVGGCVRDWLLGLPNKDFDVEVYGVSYEQLAEALSPWGRTDLVGRSFGVVKLTLHGGAQFDFSIPRRDSKVAPGHKGFQITFAADITPSEAAARRDFTINAMSWDPRARTLIDFFGGENDLRARVLRHTSAAFGEDPLRVLRGMQFTARFGLTPAPETIAICRQIKPSYGELAVERVREEWFKWASRATRPSAGLKFLEATEWIEHFPEINALRGVPQDPEWHPEGDVFIHTCHCGDALVQLPEWQAADTESRVVYSLAVLAHDFAKPQTTQRAVKDRRERIISPGHEEAGGPLAEKFLERINAPNAIRERVVPLVTNHLAHLQPFTDRAVRRLARRLEPETIEGLCVVIMADASGRPPRPMEVPAGVKALRTKARELAVQAAAPKAILLGRHLQALGMAAGPAMGRVTKAAYEAQLDGRFHDLNGADEWLLQQEEVALPAELRAAIARRHEQSERL
jgi:tRNA nucleotidyltransferase (CCA-adding enzyme)